MSDLSRHFFKLQFLSIFSKTRDLLKSRLPDVLKVWGAFFGINAVAFFLYYLIIFVVVAGLVMSLGKGGAVLSMVLTFVLSLAFLFLFAIVYLGFIRLYIKILVGLDYELKDLFIEKGLAFKFAGALIMMGVVIGILQYLIGMVFAPGGIGDLLMILVSFGVYFAVQLFPFLIVDKRLGPIASLQMSFEMVKEYALLIFLVDLCLIGLNIIGFIPFGMGLIITAPITVLVLLQVYTLILTDMAKIETEIIV